MATVNEIFLKAKEQLRAIAGDAVEIMSKKSDKVLFGLEENTDAIETKGDNIERAVKTSQQAISSSIDDVKKAIESQEVAESVTIKNPEAITGDLKAGLEGIINTLKEEVRNFDKQVVVKNDLGQLATLFKGSSDKKAVIKALKAIEDKLVKEETVDYTLILSDIAKLIETHDVRDLLKDILEKDYNVNFPTVMNVDLDPNLLEKDRVKVVLRDDQVAQLTTASANNQPIIDKLDDLVGFEIPAYDSIDLTYVASGNGVGEIETAVYKNGGVTVATLTLTYNADNEISNITKT